MGEDILKPLVVALPKWVVGALALSTVVYVFSMSAVAVLTERDVKFWPPEIGPGPKAHVLVDVAEMKENLKGSLANLHQEQRFLYDQLAKTRAKIAETKGTSGSLASYEWSANARAFEEDIKEFEGKFVSKVELLLERIAVLEEQLRESNLLCQ